MQVRTAAELEGRAAAETGLRRELFHAIAELARTRELLPAGADSLAPPRSGAAASAAAGGSLYASRSPHDGRSPPPARALLFSGGGAEAGPWADDSRLAWRIPASSSPPPPPYDFARFAEGAVAATPHGRAAATSAERPTPSPPSPGAAVRADAADPAWTAGGHDASASAASSSLPSASWSGGGGDAGVGREPVGWAAASPAAAGGGGGGVAASWQSEAQERCARKRSILVGISRQWSAHAP